MTSCLATGTSRGRERERDRDFRYGRTLGTCRNCELEPAIATTEHMRRGVVWWRRESGGTFC